MLESISWYHVISVSGQTMSEPDPKIIIHKENNLGISFI